MITRLIMIAVYINVNCAQSPKIVFWGIVFIVTHVLILNRKRKIRIMNTIMTYSIKTSKFKKISLHDKN